MELKQIIITMAQKVSCPTSILGRHGIFSIVDGIRELNSMVMVATSGQIKCYRQKNMLHWNVFYFKKKRFILMVMFFLYGSPIALFLEMHMICICRRFVVCTILGKKHYCQLLWKSKNLVQILVIHTYIDPSPSIQTGLNSGMETIPENPVYGGLFPFTTIKIWIF